MRQSHPTNTIMLPDLDQHGEPRTVTITTDDLCELVGQLARSILWPEARRHTDDRCTIGMDGETLTMRLLVHLQLELGKLPQ